MLIPTYKVGRITKDLCRLTFGGITIANNRETSSEFLGIFFVRQVITYGNLF